MYTLEELKEKMLYYKEEYGITIKFWSEKCGVPYNYFNNVLNGSKPLNKNVLRKLNRIISKWDSLIEENNIKEIIKFVK